MTDPMPGNVPAPGAEPIGPAPWEVGLLEELARYLEPRERLRAFGEMIVRILGVRFYSVFVLNRDETQFVPLLHNHHGFPPDLHVPAAPGSLMADVVSGARPVQIDAFPESSYAYPAEWKKKYLGICSLSMPLVAEGRTVGVLNLNDPREGLTTAWVEKAGKVSYHLSRVLDQASRLNAVDEWSAADAVTGLYTRRVFDELLRTEVARCRRLRVPISLLVVQVEGLRQTIERFGHFVADALLSHVANRLRELCRNVDVVARYEEKRFAVLLPGAGRPSVLEVADRILRRFEADIGVYVPGRDTVRAKLRVVVVEYPADADTPHRLLRRAEEELARGAEPGPGAAP